MGTPVPPVVIGNDCYQAVSLCHYFDPGDMPAYLKCQVAGVKEGEFFNPLIHELPNGIYTIIQVSNCVFYRYIAGELLSVSFVASGFVGTCQLGGLNLQFNGYPGCKIIADCTIQSPTGVAAFGGTFTISRGP